jgi:hypothetical protein
MTLGVRRLHVSEFVEEIPSRGEGFPKSVKSFDWPEAGRLIRLDMPEYKDGFIRLHAIHRTDTPPGPAGSWLIARFVAQAEGAADAATRRAILPASHNRRNRSARAR